MTEYDLHNNPLHDDFDEEESFDDEVEEEPVVNPFAPESQEGKVQSTYAKHGKITINQTVACTMCSRSFMPDNHTLRIHNRSELIRFLCPKCQKRDDEMMCGCARLMVTKGGFPPSIEQLVEAFAERDEALTDSDQVDPFAELRETFKHRPLTEDDIYYWIDERYFLLNKTNGQLECVIDKVYESPERAKLLGKEGLEAKKMAMNKTMRMEMEKRRR